jgi:hypothetical protein
MKQKILAGFEGIGWVRFVTRSFTPVRRAPVHPEVDGDELARHRSHAWKSTSNLADSLLAGLKCSVPNSYEYA